MPKNISESYTQFRESQVEIDSKTYTALILANLDLADGLQTEKVAVGQKTISEEIYEDQIVNGFKGLDQNNNPIIEPQAIKVLKTVQKLGDYIFEDRKVNSKFHILINQDEIQKGLINPKKIQVEVAEKELPFTNNYDEGQGIFTPKSIKINGFDYVILSGVLINENPQITPFYQLELIKA
jgi:hypothetical protein